MQEAQQMVGDLKNVELFDIATNDAWMRDYGPQFLAGSEETSHAAPPALVDWRFNSWGNKYPPFDADDAVPRQIAELTKRRRFVPGVVLEGGAIDANSRATLLAAEQCLLDPNRNQNLSRADMETLLADYCGATHILWLSGEIAGDDTEGHVDQLARFVDPTTIVAALAEDQADENYRPLRDNFDRLKTMTDEQGRSLEVIALPMPRPVLYNETRLPASYVNFYIANGVVIVPQFDDPADQRVLGIISELFPDRQILGLDAIDLVLGLGTFHCITQPEPRWY